LTCSGPAETECTGCHGHMSIDKTGKCKWNFKVKTFNCKTGYTLMAGKKCIIDKIAATKCEMDKQNKWKENNL
jgi:hypothetical protein